MPNFTIIISVVLLVTTSISAMPPPPTSKKVSCRAHRHSSQRPHHASTGHNTATKCYRDAQLLSTADIPSTSAMAKSSKSSISSSAKTATLASMSKPTIPESSAAIAPVSILSSSAAPLSPPKSISALPLAITTTLAKPDVKPSSSSSTSRPAPSGTSSASLPSGDDADSSSPVGLAINELSHAKATSFGTKVSWYLSWTLTQYPGMEGLEFVPMIKNEEMVNAFTSSQLGTAKHVLSLNEPDIAAQQGGTRMPEGTAAALHKKWTTQVPEGVQVGSVVVANGGKSYWDKWKAACGSDCRYDFIPIHFYGLNAAEFIAYAKEWADEGKPVWVTEIACRAYREGKIIKCTDDESRTMMTDSIKWMRGEGSSYIKRWTWFGVWATIPEDKDSTGALLGPDGNANALGKLYGSL